VSSAPPRSLILLLTLVSLILCLRFLSADSEQDGVAPTQPTSATDTVEPDRPVYRVTHASLGQGGTLGAAFERGGLSGEMRQAALAAAAEIVDLRRVPASTGLAFVHDDDRLIGVALRTRSDRFVRIRFDAAGQARADEVLLPVETTVETAAAIIDQSVAQALSTTRHGTRLTADYADIFQWDVDLLVDPRPGDAVRMVYEVHRLGPAPDDLPGFANSATRQGEFLRLGRILAASYEGRIASAEALWVEDESGDGDFYDIEGQPLRKSFLKSPLNYRRISSGFSRARRHPITRKVVPHHGVDFAAAPGTPVVATADGQVVAAGWDGPLGRCVRIRHGSEYVTVYGHLKGFARGVRRGVQVRQNDVIGYVGSTGRATGPHLHYTMIRSGRPINPMTFENPPSAALAVAKLPLLEAARRRFIPRLEALVPLSEEALAARAPDRVPDVASGS